MTCHRIPVENIPFLEAAIAKLAKRADKLGVAAPTIQVGPVYEIVERDDLGQEWTTAYADVDIDGEAPKFGGWTAAAIIDLDPEDGDTHVVHVLDGVEVDPGWRTETDRCDHCTQTPRGRKTLIVVEHEDGARKVVGKTCVRDFLGHISPARIAEWFTVLATLNDLGEAFETGGRIEFRGLPSRVLALGAAVIDTYGWVPRSQRDFNTPTADLVILAMIGRDKAADELRKDLADTIEARGGNDLDLVSLPEADEALEWALGLDPGHNDYLLNVQAVAGKAGWRTKDIGLGVSIIAAYRREQERLILAKFEGAKYTDVKIGAKGDKIAIAGTVTYTNDIAGAYGPVQLVKILDDATGACIIWWNSSQFTAAVGTHVTGKATVKGHDAYRDGIQTVVTRAKLIVTLGADPTECPGTTRTDGGHQTVDYHAGDPIAPNKKGEVICTGCGNGIAVAAINNEDFYATILRHRDGQDVNPARLAAAEAEVQRLVDAGERLPYRLTPEHYGAA